MKTCDKNEMKTERFIEIFKEKNKAARFFHAVICKFNYHEYYIRNLFSIKRGNVNNKNELSLI